MNGKRNEIMIQGLIAISYQDLWNNYESFSPIDCLKSVPTVSALNFVVERQNKVLYAYSDQTTQHALFYEMCCYLDEGSKKHAASFIANHPNVSLLSSETCLNFYLMALQAHNESDDKLTNDDIAKIYKVLLYATSYWTDQQSAGISQLNNDPVGMMLRIDLPTIEFKVSKDFRVQLYKACKFFDFCSKDKLYSSFLDSFCSNRGVASWQDYVLRLFNFYHASINNPWIKVEGKEIAHQSFFDNFSVLPEDCKTLWNEHDITYLRNHPLYSPKKGLYLLLNANLFVDKFYQNLKFDFSNYILSINGCNERGKVFKSYPDIAGDLGTKFSEKNLLYTLMDKIYDGIADCKFSGEYLKSKNIQAEPDFYIRCGNSLFVMEYKDLVMSDKVKYSDNVSFIKAEILDRLCLDDGKKRKGFGQILYTLDGIFNKNTLEKIDTYVDNVTDVYPIVVTTDRAFSAMGVSQLIFEKYSELSKKYNFGKRMVYLPIVVDYDTLFALAYKIHNNELSLEDLIHRYLEDKDRAAKSFYSKFNEEEIRGNKNIKEENKFLFDNIIANLFSED